MQARTIPGFGWVRDIPDQRDFMYSAPLEVLQSLPEQVDLRKCCPAVYDQGRIGSCTANALAAAVQFDRSRDRQGPDFVPSRLFIYFNERLIEGDAGYDKGAQLRDGIKTLAEAGVCSEADWPYDDTPAVCHGGPFPAGSRAATRPNQKCYDAAAKFQISVYQRLNQNLSQFQGCLAAGYPFVFGFTVYTSFFDSPGVQKRVTPMPGNADHVLGGHAVLCVGYDNSQNKFIVRNSWGSRQGDGGYFLMPYAYVTEPNLAADMWAINAVKD